MWLRRSAPEASAAGSEQNDLARDLDDRLHQIYLADAPMGPVGVLASCGFWVLLVRTSFSPGRLIAWSALMATAAAVMALAFLVPRFRGRRDGFGVPNVSKVGHLLAGIGWGLMVWIDLGAASADPKVVWQATAIHMAITAGSLSSPNGSGHLNYLVLTPLWLLTLVASIAIEHYLVAAGFAVFIISLGKNVSPASTRIRHLVTLQLRAEQASERDPLTGLLNRAGFERRLEALDVSQATVIYVDLDFFKEVNDRVGHEAGDLVLVEVADRLAAAVRSTDLVVRLGGDEFVLVVQSLSDVGQLAHRLIADIERPIVTGRGEASVSASVGWVDAEVTDDLDELFRRADAALREAKQGGRRRAVNYTHVRAADA